MATLPGKHEQPAVDSVSVAAVRAARGWSRRELARRLGVSAEAVRGWEASGFPAERASQLRSLLELAPVGFTATRLADLLARYGWMHADLGERIGVERSTVTRWSRGAPIPPARQDQLRELEAAAPNELRSWREAIGWTQIRLARGLGVSPARVAQWENGGLLPEKHREALERLREEIAPPPSGESIRIRRDAKGFSQAELARRVGVPPARVSEWEGGLRRVPDRWRPALERAFATRARGHEIDQAVLELLARRPGLRVAEVLACVSPEHYGSARGSLDRLVAAGGLELVEGEAEDMPGRLRRVRRFYLRGHAVTVEPPARAFSGAMLRRHRREKNLTQAELARRLGVTREAVRSYEHSPVVPPARRRALLQALQEPAPTPLRGRAVSALPDLRERRTRAGLTQPELAARLGMSRGQAQISAWERLDHPVSAARARQILEVLEEAASEPTLAASELLEGRTRAGWTQCQLGQVLGVGRGTIRRWEAGAPVPRRRWPHIRAVLSAAPSAPRPTAMPDLRARREALHWSQYDLAERLGVWQAAVSEWERGAPVPPELCERLEDELSSGQPKADRETRLREEIETVVRDQPGLSGKQILARVPGNWRDVSAAIAESQAAGRIHERATAYRDGQGRRRWRPGLYLGGDERESVTDGLNGEQVIARRERVGWGQSELARRLDVSPTTVWRWEHGTAKIPAEFAQRVEQLLSKAEARLPADWGDRPPALSGPQLRAARARLAMSQRAFGTLVGVGRDTIGDWEAGRAIPTWRLADLHRALQRAGETRPAR